MTEAQVYDNRLCKLGEGPLWHPERGQLFWFDILNDRLLSQEGGRQLEWRFDRRVSAAGWIDRDTLLVAGAGALLRFDLSSGQSEHLCDLEADKPQNRSNDGRADPFGGFWIGTMGRKSEARAGSIYRYYRGELRRMFPGITIPNAISFSPDGGHAFFADTREKTVWRQKLDGKGWPAGEPEIFLETRTESLNPDGAVVDSEGHLWVAQWGAGRVARYTPEGNLDQIVSVAASQASCPAFGGPDLTTLFMTTARDDLEEAALRSEPLAGATFTAQTIIRGQAEHRVIP